MTSPSLPHTDGYQTKPFHIDVRGKVSNQKPLKIIFSHTHTKHHQGSWKVMKNNTSEDVSLCGIHEDKFLHKFPENNPLDVVPWLEYVGMKAEGFPPVHKINLGRLTQDESNEEASILE